MGLTIPIIQLDGTITSQVAQAKIAKLALRYEEENTPPFLSDLVDFATKQPVSLIMPGHHNGRYFVKELSEVVFNKFFVKNLLFADISDTVTELGDTMTHTGTPLLAGKLVANVYHADKAYFCPNGTTGSNDVCVSAVIRVILYYLTVIIINCFIMKHY